MAILVMKRGELVVFLTIVLGGILWICYDFISPLVRATAAIRKKPGRIVGEARELFEMSESAGQFFWRGNSESLPEGIRALGSNSVQVDSKNGIVKIALTSGFYHSGIFVTSDTQSLSGRRVVSFPVEPVAPNVFSYQGVAN